MQLLALSSPADFRETLVCSVLTCKYSASCRIRTWSYLCIYLAYLFQLPIFFALLLRGGKMTHPHQVLGASLPAPVSTHYIQSKKALFQLLETKRTKQEPSPLCPEAEGGHWYGSTTPSQISPGCFYLPEN